MPGKEHLSTCTGQHGEYDGRCEVEFDVALGEPEPTAIILSGLPENCDAELWVGEAWIYSLEDFDKFVQALTETRPRFVQLKKETDGYA